MTVRADPITRAWRAVGRWPAPVRHLILAVIVATLGVLALDVPTWHALRVELAAAVLAVFTPLVQYRPRDGDR